MVTNSLKERKIDSKKGKFGSDMFVLLCISFTVKVVIYSGVYVYVFYSRTICVAIRYVTTLKFYFYHICGAILSNIKLTA